MSDVNAASDQPLNEPDIDHVRRLVRLSASPMALVQVNTLGFDSCSVAFAALFGYRQDEMVGHTLTRWYQPSGAAGAQVAQDARTLLERGSVQVERLMHRRDGSHMVCDLQGSLVVTRPQPIAMFVLRDVSPQRRAEAMFRALLDNMPVAILCVNRADRMLLHANRLASELLGHELESNTPYRLPDDATILQQPDGTPYPVQRCPIHLTLQTGSPQHADDLFICRQNGSRVHLEGWTSPVSWSGGATFDAVVAMFQDITERSRSQAAQEQDRRRQARNQAQLFRDEKMRSIATLAGGVAHDFNNILVSVLGNASLVLSEMPPDHPWRPALTAVVDGAQRAASTTRELLAYARAGAFSPHPAFIDPVIEKALPLCRSALPGGVQLEFEGNCPGGVVAVDPSQLQQILLNLVINAAEAMPKGGAVRLQTHSDHGPADSPLSSRECVCLSVRDQGCGIREDLRDQIFEPFVTSKEFGRGLGLATVFGMITNHGAEIRLASPPGEPAEFALYFPLYRGQP